MTDLQNLPDIRRDYGQFSLSDESVVADPLIQFKLWFEEITVQEKNDPTAMVLSTVDEQGLPDSRVVLLKGLEEGQFVFYTNYQSTKAQQISENHHVALNFYWPETARQVRVRGSVTKVSAKASDNYFSSRPINSQLSAVISPQSKEIAGRAVLEDALNDLIAQSSNEQIKRPDYWGGYKVAPQEIEFWQGRDNRLHDRIHYYRQKEEWLHHRLAP